MKKEGTSSKENIGSSASGRKRTVQEEKKPKVEEVEELDPGVANHLALLDAETDIDPYYKEWLKHYYIPQHCAQTKPKTKVEKNVKSEIMIKEEKKPKLEEQTKPKLEGEGSST